MAVIQIQVFGLLELIGELKAAKALSPWSIAIEFAFKLALILLPNTFFLPINFGNF
jgi:hypothetical protein